MALRVGEQVGQYEVIEQVGAGGMATVYKAYHARLDRYVAIKVMHPTFLQNDAFLSRFEREARIVARLEHPHIVPVYDFSEIDKAPYLVMKFVEGRTLKESLREGTLSPDALLNIFTPVAAALDYAHSQGVLHRDIKPSNIMLDGRGVPYLTDFGLARLALAGESTMSADMMLGTPHYISPEQASGNTTLDSRTDIYSLGVVLYEALTGRVPYQGDTPYAIVHHHIYTPVPRPSEVNPAITPAVEQVLMRALAKNPAERYATAGEMVAALRQAMNGSDAPAVNDSARQTIPAAAAPPPPPRPPAPPPVVRPAAPPEPFGENFGRRMGEAGARWGENFAQQVESWVEERTGGSPAAPRINRQEWRAGTKWTADGFEGAGWYTETELREHEERMEAGMTDEERIRRRVEKRIEERQGFYSHLGWYLGVNILLWMIWLFNSIGEEAFVFPWPLFPTLFWGIGIVSHFYSYYNEHGAGRNRREALIEREVERERDRLSGMMPKLKNDERVLRLTEDGELTDSFVQETDPDEKRKNR